MFITDGCYAERNDVRCTWPDSTQLLKVFHYLQSWWRFTLNYRFTDVDRQPIMQMVRKLVYTNNEVNLEQCCHKLISDKSTTASYICKYPQVIECPKFFWKRRSEWALSY